MTDLALFDAVPWLGDYQIHALGMVALFFLWFVYRRYGDEYYGGRFFPEALREELRDRCRGRGGYRCPTCKKKVRRKDLCVDHIVPHVKGGKTSRHNAQIMCRKCNSSKGTRLGVREHFMGRRYGLAKRWRGRRR